MKTILKKIFNPIVKIENESISFKLGFWKSIGVLSLYLLLTVISMLMCALLFALFLPYESVDNMMGVILLLDVITMPLFLLILSKVFGKKTYVINKHKKTNKKIIFQMALVVLSFRLIFDSLIGPILNLIPMDQSLVDTAEEMSNFILLMLIAISIVAPIIEEFIFRGIILNGLLNKYSPSKSILISSLLFAAIHGNIHQGVNTFLLAVIFGYIFYKTRSIYLTILLHFFNNTIIFFLIEPTTTIGMVLNIIISCLIGSLILVYLKKNMNLTYEQDLESTIKNDENLYFNEQI